MKKLARKLYRWLSVHRWLQTEGVRKALSRLHRGTIKQTEEAVEAYYVDSLHKLLLIGSGILVLCGMLWLQECVNDEAGIHLTMVKKRIRTPSRMRRRIRAGRN